MSKCKSVLCSNKAIPNHDFCSECIDRYVMAILSGNLRAVVEEENESDPCEGCEGCDEDFEYEVDPSLELAAKYPQYYKDVSHLNVIDVYAVHDLFDIRDPSGAIQHASKKLLLSGVRTGGKSVYEDIKEARDTLNRWLDIYANGE